MKKLGRFLIFVALLISPMLLFGCAAKKASESPSAVSSPQYEDRGEKVSDPSAVIGDFFKRTDNRAELCSSKISDSDIRNILQQLSDFGGHWFITDDGSSEYKAISGTDYNAKPNEHVYKVIVGEDVQGFSVFKGDGYAIVVTNPNTGKSYISEIKLKKTEDKK